MNEAYIHTNTKKIILFGSN